MFMCAVFFLVGQLSFNTFAEESKCPVSVSKQRSLYSEIIVQAKADSVTIQKVVVNRGNARFFGSKYENLSPEKLPKILKFAEHWKAYVITERETSVPVADILEVAVVTDQGSCTFSW
jgi:hypothetical protein